MFVETVDELHNSHLIFFFRVVTWVKTHAACEVNVCGMT